MFWFNMALPLLYVDGKIPLPSVPLSLVCGLTGVNGKSGGSKVWWSLTPFFSVALSQSGTIEVVSLDFHDECIQSWQCFCALVDSPRSNIRDEAKGRSRPPCQLNKPLDNSATGSNGREHFPPHGVINLPIIVLKAVIFLITNAKRKNCVSGPTLWFLCETGAPGIGRSHWCTGRKAGERQGAWNCWTAQGGSWGGSRNEKEM